MIKAILTDIEGTISSISYVKDVMFPYSLQRLGSFLKENWDTQEVRQIINLLSQKLSKQVSLEEATEIFKEWIEKDLKETALKELQGLIWEEGFKNGELKGHIYPDAYEKLKEWKEKGLKIYVFSSGSVKAQKLFFSYSVYGDITYLFNGFFDTKIGSKKEVNSYLEIAKSIDTQADDILFLSDVEEELDCAKSAGMHTYRIVREEESTSKHPVAKNFYQVVLPDG